MITKYLNLPSQLQKKMHAFYAIVGEELYLSNEAILAIKKAWHPQADEKIIYINNSADWQLLAEEANSYSLFSEHSLLIVHFEKKNLDNVGKTAVSKYLQNPNPRCLIILQANTSTLKQFQWMEKSDNAVAVSITAFTENDTKKWIIKKLQEYQLTYEAQVPSLIFQYTMGNLMACAQTIEKLSLIDERELLTSAIVEQQLVEQNEFNLYAFRDNVLQGDTGQALHMLQQARGHKVEPTLILWLLTQEIRQLIQLKYLLKQSIEFHLACQQLKIWTKHVKLYNDAISKLSLQLLFQLLKISERIDLSIKTSQTDRIWHGFDELTLLLSRGD